jgi:sugar lactone lactonase YvrE
MSQRLGCFVFVCTMGLFGCNAPVPITSCEPIGAATPLCGYQNPEDLALLPGGRHVLVSEYGDSGERAGRISLLDLTSNQHTSLFAGAEPIAAGPWGAPDCAGPPSKEFSPHGIHLAQRADGLLQLLVVNHGAGESVEMFEVVRDGERWQLAWRGCAKAPDDLLNDVVALPEGGFLATRFAPKSRLSLLFALTKSMLFGSDTGWVYTWTRERGFSEVPGTRAAGANGVELSADGAKIFLNLTIASEVLRIDRRTGAIEARVSVPLPDNSTWSRDGRLLVASLRGPARELFSCSGLERGTCPMPFAIVALDPQTMKTKTVYEGGPGTPSGGATVGLETDGALLIGTYAGDRIVRVEHMEQSMRER